MSTRLIRSKGKRRKPTGFAIVEAGAVCAVLLPLITILSYAAWQTAMYLYLVNIVNEAARTAARGCAIAYGSAAGGSVGSADSQGSNVAPAQPSAVYSNPTTTLVEGSTASTAYPAVTPNQVFSSIRVNSVITNNNQFTATYTPPAPNNQDTSYAIGRVTVTVVYNGHFPQPDVLGISKMLNMKPTASCTYPLEY